MSNITHTATPVARAGAREEIAQHIALQQTISAGDRRVFYSTSVGHPDDNPRLCHYTGEPVTVIKATWDASMPGFDPEESEPVFTVRADDGVRFEAFAGEIDGWYLRTRQYVLPDGSYCKPAVA